MCTFPVPTAGPREVREYLANILVTRHDATRAFAEETASLWDLGRGIDLRHASKRDFIRIFGDKVGPYLFHTVREDILEQWRGSAVGIACFYVTITSLIISAFLFFQASKGTTLKQVKGSLRHAFLALGLTFLTYTIQEPEGVLKVVLMMVGLMSWFLAFLLYVSYFAEYLENKKQPEESPVKEK